MKNAFFSWIFLQFVTPLFLLLSILQAEALSHLTCIGEYFIFDFLGK